MLILLPQFQKTSWRGANSAKLGRQGERMGIVVFGSINIDISVYGERLPKPGETLHGDSYALGLGGKGCNQAVALRRLRADVQLVGRTGDDEFGALARKSLNDFGVADDHVARDGAGATGVGVISIDAQGENCISVIAGANMAIGVADVERSAAVFAQADLLLLQLEIPLAASRRAMDAVRAAGGRVILDPAPVPAGGLSDPSIFTAVDVMTPNETETEALVGLLPATPEEAQQAAALLHDKGLVGAVIKMGGRGVYYSEADQQGFVPPFSVAAIDSVAAGDCFNGGLAFALARGDDIGAAVRFAAACGALATTRPGAAAAAPSLNEVNELLNR